MQLLNGRLRAGTLLGTFALLGFVLAAVFAVLSPPAYAATPAETFVDTNIQTGLSILRDKNLSPSDRRARIHAFLLSLLDTKRIAIYALGPAAQSASPADLDAYTDAFRDFMVANYDSRLGGYDGQSLNVTGSVQHGPGDYIVSAVLVDPSQPANSQAPEEVDLRVVDENGKFFVVDASIEGIWLAIAQHDDFAGFLKQHDGSVAALTAHLKDMTAQLDAGAAPPR